MTNPTIIFFGTSEFAVPALDALIRNGFTPSVIVTALDRPKGRSQRLTPPPIKKWLEIAKPGLAIVQPEMIDSTFITYILNLKPDVGIVAAYGKILPKALIELFPRGILNIHPSLLPKYRGPSPIRDAIVAGDVETGVSIIQIDEKMDHGPLIATAEYNISTSVTYQELNDGLANLGAQLLVQVLPKWLVGGIEPCPQDDTKATYTKLLKKEDGRIDWSKDAVYIERVVRAYNPWPGAFAIFHGESLKVKKAEVIVAPFDKEAGFVFETDGFPAVVCGKDALKLLAVQPPGKAVMPADAYLRGHHGF